MGESTACKLPTPAPAEKYPRRHRLRRGRCSIQRKNNFDEAFALYLLQPPTNRSVHRVLELAVEIDTRRSAEDAIAYLSSAPEDVQGQILCRRVSAGHIEVLSQILGKIQLAKSNRSNRWLTGLNSSTQEKQSRHPVTSSNMGFRSGYRIHRSTHRRSLKHCRSPEQESNEILSATRSLHLFARS